MNAEPHLIPMEANPVELKVETQVVSQRCLHFFSSSICWKTKDDLIFIEVKYVLFLKIITTTKKPASSERLTEVGSQMDLTAGGSRGWVTRVSHAGGSLLGS